MRQPVVAVILLSVACGSQRDATESPVDAAVDGASEVATTDATSDDRADILWVGAHPDDEMMIAPLLGRDCVDGGLRCALLTMTRGEAGRCKRPELCSEALAIVRARELEASSRVFGAKLESWDLGDGTSSNPVAVAELWAARAGGRDVLVARMTDALRKYAPRTVYAFDPRHGSTCHADHRAAGALVIVAARALGSAAPNVVLLESRPDTTDPTAIGFVPAVGDDPALQRFDATLPLASIANEAWLYGVRVLEVHKTQFTDAEVAAFRNAPREKRAVYTSPLTSLREDDARYQKLCAP